MELLGIVIMVAPIVFTIWYKIKQQTRQFVLALVSMFVMIIAIVGMSSNHDEQVIMLENVYTDFSECLDRAETGDDLATCLLLMDSDITLYNRQY